MLVLKIIACIMIVIPSSIIGIMIGKRYSNRVKNINDLINCLLILETEIVYLSNPVKVAFKNVHKKMRNNTSYLFKETIELLNMNTNITLYYALKEVINKSGSSLDFNEDDLNILLSLGKVIGITDKEEQKKYFDSSIQQLKIQRQQAIEKMNKNENLYKKLGVLLGMLIILIFI